MIGRRKESAGRLRLPSRKLITRIGQDDPLLYYYVPIIGSFYRKRLRLILDLIRERHYGSLLEVAYGSGVFLPSLTSLCDRLYGLDIHDRTDVVQEMLEKNSLRAELTSSSVLAMPYKDETFDCVVSVSMLEHLVNPGKAIDEMLRVLKPDGVLALGFPVRNLVTDTLLRLVGYDVEKIHPSSHRDILEALDERCPQYRLVTIPRWVPLNFSLYCCCVVERPEGSVIR